MTQYLPDEPYYYQDATERLSTPTEPLVQPVRRLDTWLPVQPTPITIALVAIGAGAFRLGWLAREWFAGLAPWIDARGWIALLFIVIAVPLLLVWRGNHKIAGTWPENWI